MYFDMIETFKPTEGFELTRWDFVLEKVIWHDRNLAPPEGFELTRWDSKDPRSSPTILRNFTKDYFNSFKLYPMVIHYLP